jgi:hypothetical protein
MKNILLFVFSGLFCQFLNAHVMGNYAEKQQTYQNISPNAQYRGVPKAAQFINDNQIEISINSRFPTKKPVPTRLFSASRRLEKRLKKPIICSMVASTDY